MYPILYPLIGGVFYIPMEIRTVHGKISNNEFIKNNNNYEKEVY